MSKELIKRIIPFRVFQSENQIKRKHMLANTRRELQRYSIMMMDLNTSIQKGVPIIRNSCPGHFGMRVPLISEYMSRSAGISISDRHNSNHYREQIHDHQRNTHLFKNLGIRIRRQIYYSHLCRKEDRYGRIEKDCGSEVGLDGTTAGTIQDVGRCGGAVQLSNSPIAPISLPPLHSGKWPEAGSFRGGLECG